MAYQTPRTWVAGEYPTATQLNQDLRDNVSFLANPPACRVGRSAVQSIPNNAWTAVLFDTERFDTDNMHSTVSNTHLITINTPGIYDVSGVVEFAASATGTRGIRFWVSAGYDIGLLYFPANAIFGTGITTSIHWKFNAGETVAMEVFQNSGGALNAQKLTAAPEFAAVWVGRG